MTNNLRIFLFPICYCLLFSMQKSSSTIPSAQNIRRKMLISHVGKWWHVRQPKDFWHMVHIWGFHHEYLDHTACSCTESLTAVYGVEQTNPLHYALQVMHATGLVCPNSAVYNVLKRSCQSLPQPIAASDNEHKSFYMNKNHEASLGFQPDNVTQTCS